MASLAKRKCDDVLKGIEAEKRLVEAAERGDIEEATSLLKQGVCADASDYNKQLFYQSENYMTPLQFATQNGFPALVKLFIKYGACVDARDRFDVTALHTAAERGHTACLQLLLDGNADCNISTKYSKHGSYTAVPHPGGTTPLHLASGNNHIECVRMLIWNGADYNAVDEHCRTSLYIASARGLSDCVHAHLDNAIWKDILSIPEKHLGDTPLHECVKNNMLDCVVKLLDRGSDVNHCNALGQSPLHLAVRAGENFNFNILKQLVMRGYNTDVNLKEKTSNYTALHYVTFSDTMLQERRPEVAAFLIAYGADYSIRNKQGEDVLQSELKGRHRDMVILNAIVKATARLPSLEDMGVVTNSNPYVNPPHQRQLFQQHHHQQQQQLLLQQQLQQQQQQQQQQQHQQQQRDQLHQDNQQIQQQHLQIQQQLQQYQQPLHALYQQVLAHQHQQQQQQQPQQQRTFPGFYTSSQCSKFAWYNDLLKGPRTLQHYCRCVIRDAMGDKRLRMVGGLPLPTPMKEFVMLEHDDFR